MTEESPAPVAINRRHSGKLPQPYLLATLAKPGCWRIRLANIVRQWPYLVRWLRICALRLNDPHWTMVISTLRLPQVFIRPLEGV